MVQTCVSSRKEITNDSGSVQFTCPACQKATIVRSKNARQIAARYTCSCGFSGPN
ncbi:MAG TPA: zinc finger domain-containing protein [Acidobacteriota bacterium]|nr:zinc finger domain-containing protein [Acidobacteriota bacterium]